MAKELSAELRSLKSDLSFKKDVTYATTQLCEWSVSQWCSIENCYHHARFPQEECESSSRKRKRSQHHVFERKNVWKFLFHSEVWGTGKVMPLEIARGHGWAQTKDFSNASVSLPRGSKKPPSPNCTYSFLFWTRVPNDYVVLVFWADSTVSTNSSFEWAQKFPPFLGRPFPPRWDVWFGLDLCHAGAFWHVPI